MTAVASSVETDGAHHVGRLKRGRCADRRVQAMPMFSISFSHGPYFRMIVGVHVLQSIVMVAFVHLRSKTALPIAVSWHNPVGFP